MTRGLTPAQASALRTLAAEVESGTYLAGGVAVARELGHRLSRDLDLFVASDFDPERLAERIVARVRDARVTGTAPGTLHLEVKGIPVSILTYRYPTLSEPTYDEDLGVRIASPEDLVCMKLSAIASRGTARDFWDLHALLKHGVAGGTVPHALELYQKKFEADDVGHVIKSLTYFADAEAAPLPWVPPERTLDVETVEDAHRLRRRASDSLVVGCRQVERHGAELLGALLAEIVEELPDRVAALAGSDPHDSAARTVLVVGDDRHVLVMAAIAELVDPDVTESLEAVGWASPRHDPLDDLADRSPGDPHHVGDRRLVGALGQVGDVVLEGG